MATKTFRVATTTTNNSGDLLEADQTAANRTDGWTSGKVGAASMSEFDAATKQGTGSFTAAVKPASFITGTACNAFSPVNSIRGTFANTAWTFTFNLRCTTASAQRGRMRMRVFKSANAAGTGATELTGATQIGTTVAAALSTTVDQTSTVTWSPGTTIVLNDEYLFFVLAWEITTAGGANGADVVIRTGQAAAGSRLVTPDFTFGPPLAFPRTASDTIVISDSAGAIIPPKPDYDTVIDDFNRANGLLDAGAGAAIWNRVMFDGVALDPQLRTIGSMLGLGTNGYQSSYTKQQVQKDFDVLINCITSPSNEVGLFVISTPGASFSGWALYWASGQWILRRFAAGVNQGNLAQAAGPAPNGYTIWFRKRGSDLKLYSKRYDEQFYSIILSATNAAFDSPGVIAIELNDTAARFGPLRGGPLIAPVAPTYETIIDDFNRADGKVGATGLWVDKYYQADVPSDLRVISNQLASAGSGTQAYTVSQIEGANCDVLIDCVAKPTNDFVFFPLLTQPGPNYSGYEIVWSPPAGTDLVQLNRIIDNTPTSLDLANASLAAGDTLWFSKRGADVKLYRRPSGGSFAEILAATDPAPHSPTSGAIGATCYDATGRWDNLRGGPIAVVADPPTVSVVDDFNRANQYPPGSAWTGSWNVDGFRIVSNQLRNPSGSWDGIVWNATPAVDQECYVTAAAFGATPGPVQLWTRRDQATDTGYYLSLSHVAGDNDYWEIFRRVSGADARLGLEVTRTVAVGDAFGIKVTGSKIEGWHKPSGGSWTLVMSRTNTEITAAGLTGIFTNNPAWIFDNWGSIPAVQAPQAFPRTATDSVTISDSAVRAPVARPRTAADSWVNSDSATRAPGARTRGATDSWTRSDTATRASGSRVRTASDSWTVSDSTTRSTGGANYAAAVMADGPILYYRLGESAGTIAVAEAGPNGTYNGPTLAQPGPIADGNTAARFDGVDDNVVIPSSLSIPAGNSITIEFWLHAAGADLGNQIAFALNLADPDRAAAILWSDGILYWDYRATGSSATNRVTIPYGPWRDKWTLVQLTFDAASGNHAITLDGSEVVSVIAADAPITSSVGGQIGRFFTAAPDPYWFKGLIDEFAVYDKALTPARRLAHYEARVGIGTMFTRTAVDSWVVSDNAGAVVTPVEPLPPKTASDAWSLSDTAVRAPATLTRPAADVVTISDTAVRAPATRIRPAVDTVSFSDVATRPAGARIRTATDSWAGSDTAARAPSARTRPAADAFSVNDVAVRAAAARTRGAVDSFSFVDSTTSVTQVTQGKTAADSWSVSDIVKRGPAVEAPPFAPTEITGLALWLDASQLPLGPLGSAWNDLSGAGNHGNIVGTPSPTIVAGSNALPVARFKMSEGRVRGTHGATTDYTLLYITRMWGPNVGRVYTSTYPPFNFLVGCHGGWDCMYDTNWIKTPVSYPAVPTPWKLYGADGQSAGGYEARFFIDGVLSGQGPGSGMGGSYNLSGYSIDETQETCDCEVAEVVVYNRKLSEVERQQVENYLHEKWIVGAAPAAPMFTRTAVDAVAFSDSAVKTSVQQRTATDSVAFADSTIAKTGVQKTATDAWSTADTANRTAARPRQVADIVAISDSSTRIVARPRPVSDSITFNDVAIGIKVVVRGTSDAWSNTDAATRAATARIRTAVDSWTGSDTAVRAPSARLRGASDAVTLSDTVSRTPAARVRTATDSWSTADTAASITIGGSIKSALDTVVFSDVALRAAAARSRTAIDSWSSSDSVARTSARPRSAVDAWANTDSATRLKIGPRTAVDIVVTSDIAVRAPTVRPRTATDSVAFSDTSTRTALHPGRTAIDNWTLSDTSTAQRALKRPAADAFSVTDIVSRGTTRQRQTTDIFIVSDTAQPKVSRPRFTADSWTSSDTVKGSGSRARITVDIIAFSDVAGQIMRAGADPQMTMML